MPRKLHSLALVAVALALAGFWCGAAHGQEVIVSNDDGNPGVPCVCFIPTDDVAAWLQSPCGGSIVAVQVYWGSVVGGAFDTIENSISVRSGPSFPNDLGPVLLLADGVTPATVTSPTLSDGVFNEFRFLEPTNITPLDVPVTNGQQFVVSLNIFNQSSGQDPNFTPSVFADTDGCQAGKNSVTTGGNGVDACQAGVAGDWMIRAIVDCSPQAIPAASEWGLALLALFLLAIGTVVYRRRPVFLATT